MTFLDGRGGIERSFKRLTVSWMDPHTTQKGARSCKGCHSDPRALGLGPGNLSYKGGEWSFKPSGGGASKALSLSHPISQFVTIRGIPLVNVSRKGRLRPFNKGEIARILKVGLCLECHGDFRSQDHIPIRWEKIRVLKCPKMTPP